MAKPKSKLEQTAVVFARKEIKRVRARIAEMEGMDAEGFVAHEGGGLMFFDLEAKPIKMTGLLGATVFPTHSAADAAVAKAHVSAVVRSAEVMRDVLISINKQLLETLGEMLKANSGVGEIQ